MDGSPGGRHSIGVAKAGKFECVVRSQISSLLGVNRDAAEAEQGRMPDIESAESFS